MQTNQVYHKILFIYTIGHRYPGCGCIKFHISSPRGGGAVSSLLGNYEVGKDIKCERMTNGRGMN